MGLCSKGKKKLCILQRVSKKYIFTSRIIFIELVYYLLCCGVCIIDCYSFCSTAHICLNLCNNGTLLYWLNLWLCVVIRHGFQFCYEIIYFYLFAEKVYQ